ncbi:hypothetical protein DIPPA_06170 [Diplonema papillatum]|nr:hypothetical protein DIPPA_06170 [Diplonema papillatum]
MASLKAFALLAVMAISVDAKHFKERNAKHLHRWKPYEHTLAMEWVAAVVSSVVGNVTAIGESLAPFLSEDVEILGGPASILDLSPSVLEYLIIDPLVEFNITITDWSHRPHGRHGRKIALEGYGRGLSTAGLVYKQEYRMSFHFNRHRKIERFQETLDSFASACFTGKIPVAVCAANGLQGREV